MVSKQPEALRLADWFDSFYLTTSQQAKAAATAAAGWTIPSR